MYEFEYYKVDSDNGGEWTCYMRLNPITKEAIAVEWDDISGDFHIFNGTYTEKKKLIPGQLQMGKAVELHLSSATDPMLHTITATIDAAAYSNKQEFLTAMGILHEISH